MTGFDVVSLYLLVVFAVLGMIAPFALAAKHRQPVPAVVALVIAVWVIVVLVSAAVQL